MESKLPPNGHKVYVIRQEHLWEDWSNVNAILASNGAVTARRDNDSGAVAVVDSTAVTSHRNITGLLLPVTRTISNQGRMKLCKALQEEYRAYFRLLQQAKNIDETDMEDCRRIAERNCAILDIAGMIDSLGSKETIDITS